MSGSEFERENIVTDALSAAPVSKPVEPLRVWPLLMAKIFGPQSVPSKFAGFPKEMAVRPSQIRASAAELNRGSLNSAHIHGTDVPVEEPSTASRTDIHRSIAQSAG